MTCSTCKHRIVADGKMQCEICKTTVYAVGDFDLGAGMPYCRYEALSVAAKKTTAPHKKTAKKAVATAQTKEKDK